MFGEDYYSVLEPVREPNEASFMTLVRAKLEGERIPKKLVQMVNDLLDGDKVEHYDGLEYLIKFAINHQDRDLLLHEIFTHPKSVSHPDLFFRLFNIYANEPEKTFEILKENFSEFIRNIKNDNRGKKTAHDFSQFISPR
jgi:hypothetical protein